MKQLIDLLDKFVSFAKTQPEYTGAAPSAAAPVLTAGFVFPEHRETQTFPDGFTADVGEYGQPVPVTNPDATPEENRRAWLRHLQYSDFGATTFGMAFLAAAGLKYIGSPERQHADWLLAQRTQGSGNVVAAGPA